MRVRNSCRFAILTAVLALTGSAVMASGAAAQPSIATERITVRPVETNHHLAPGYHVRNASGTVSCTPAEASVVAVSDDIFSCSPSAAYAVACFQANTPHYVLCEDHPRGDHYLARFRADGAIPRVDRPSHAEPLVLVLTDGISCNLRDGGATDPLSGRPDYAITYFCTGDRAVWAYEGNRYLGVHETAPRWTVRTAPADGQGRLYSHYVASVYYVGSAAS